MDGQAIDKIIDICTVANNNQLVFDTSNAVYVSKGYELVSLEKFQDTPDRFKGAFTASSLTSFVSYINGYCSTSNPVIFIDKNSMSAKAIIDFGQEDAPKWQDNTALFEADKSPGYQSLLKFCCGKKTQEEAVDFFSEWLEDIEFFRQNFDDGNEYTIDKYTALSAFKRLKSVNFVELNSERDSHSSSKSILERTEASGVERGTLPTIFKFYHPAYFELGAVEFVCKINSTVNNDAVSFSARIFRHDKILELLENDFKKQIVSSVHSDCSVFFGTYSSDNEKPR